MMPEDPIDPIFYWAAVVFVWSGALLIAGFFAALFLSCVKDMFSKRDAP